MEFLLNSSVSGQFETGAAQRRRRRIESDDQEEQRLPMRTGQCVSTTMRRGFRSDDALLPGR